MDPDELLNIIRTRTETIRKLASDGQYDSANDEAITLVDDVENLDTWITKGGFLPESWRKRTVTMWQVNASVSWVYEGWQRALNLPIFVLNGAIQGITGEAHAKQIAADMLSDLVTLRGTAPAVSVVYHVTVVPIEVTS